MLEKKGIPDKVSHQFKGCVSLDGKLYVSLEEVHQFCQRFNMLTGQIIANILQKSFLKYKEGVFPEVVRVSTKSRIKKALLKFLSK